MKFILEIPAPVSTRTGFRGNDCVSVPVSTRAGFRGDKFCGSFVFWGKME
ncbi:MAG: hypothetical protein OXJ52_04615 [Oligoflexia bacterium]|nr:hypothetical protein [Oligoflexia bacterium]